MATVYFDGTISNSSTFVADHFDFRRLFDGTISGSSTIDAIWVIRKHINDLKIPKYINLKFTSINNFQIGDIEYSDEEDALTTAVLISLFTWRRAKEGDVNPDEFKYGWWADTYNQNKIGSRLWLLRRKKITNALIPKINTYVNEALQWLIDDEVISKLKVDSQRTGINNVSTKIQITRHDGSIEQLAFNNVWEKYQRTE